MTLNQTYISTYKRVDKQQNQTLEEAEDEIQLLREQIRSLLQQLFEQSLRQQEVETELKGAKQEVELMNAENQQLFEAKLLFLRELKKIASSLPANQVPLIKELVERQWLGYWANFMMKLSFLNDEDRLNVAAKIIQIMALLDCGMLPSFTSVAALIP